MSESGRNGASNIQLEQYIVYNNLLTLREDMVKCV